jgi:hypothetical protein
MHFQHNFEAPKSTEFDLFIRYLISLQSKLYRTQEAPSDRERIDVIESMTKLEKFDIVNQLGQIVISDPNKIYFHPNESLSESQKSTAQIVLTDFTRTFQFLADWMLKTKALS